MDENENIIQIISIDYFMNTNLKKNKVVLITGSSRGIGASLANYFATNKYYTVINYSKSKDEAVKLYKNISKIIDKKYLLLCKADVSIRNDVKKMYKKIINVFGKLDILINNAGLNIDFEGLTAYYEAEPNLKNKIQQFNDREIVFVAQGDEVDSETLGQPQGDIPPEEKVERMAKRAMKAREGINEGYEGKIEALLADLGIDGFFRDDVLYVDPDRLDDAEDALIYADEIYEIPEIKSKTELHKPGRDKYDRAIPNAFGYGSYGPKRFAENVKLDEVEDPGRIGADGGSEYKVVEYTRGGQGQTNRGGPEDLLTVQ